MKLKTVADVSVTATPAVTRLPESGGTYTILNTDTANSVYVLHDPNSIPEGDVATLAGLAAALAALGAVEIKAGQGHVLSGVPWFHAVCATGLTATLRVLPGALVFDSSISGALNNLDYVVSARYTATITASALLTAAGGFTAVFAANTVRIILIPRGDMYWNIGAAADNTKSLIGQGTPLNMPITKTVADTVYVYAAGAGVVCDLLVCTPRA